jgi:hypothetical protein
MVQFTYTPSQYYAKTPVGNQPTDNFYNNLVQSTQNSGNQSPNRAALTAYDPKNPVPGTVGYSLPAQTYYNYGVNNPSNYGVQTLKTALVNTAINVAATSIAGLLTGSDDPVTNRLIGSGLNLGATNRDILTASQRGSNTAFQDDSEDRVIIYDQTGKFIGQSEIFAPLNNINGVLFPYTPTIQVSHRASYDAVSLVHTNYVTPQYQHSQIDNISISGIFTANYPAEAEYIIAMMHFFKTATKMFYGQDQIAGTPPPVLFLDAHGPFAFDHIPVVITSFDYTMPNDVDYISCTVRTQKQKVPTSLQVSLSMMPTYSRNNISNNFGLTSFSQGKLITGAMGNRTRTGGWI